MKVSVKESGGSALRFLLLLCFLLSTCHAVSLNCEYGGGGGPVSTSTNYDLDTSTDLNTRLVLDDGISQVQCVDGTGTNEISQTYEGQTYTLSDEICSSELVKSASASYATGESICTAQASYILGTDGYTGASGESSGDVVRVVDGVNGAGVTKGVRTMSITSDGVSTSGDFQSKAFQLGDLRSKAYSAVEATSADGRYYDYASSESLDSHVGAEGVNVLDDGGDILKYTSTSDGGDAGLEPTPGAWASVGGYLDSNPFIIGDVNGAIHIYVAGGDHDLWDNKDGDWFGRGGALKDDSSPYAVEDRFGRIHVLCRGADDALLDWFYYPNAEGSSDWHNFGGVIKSDASAVLQADPYPDHLAIVAVGGDDAIWMCDLDTILLGTAYEDVRWYSLGGVVAGNPYIIQDPTSPELLRTYVRGGGNSGWENLAAWNDGSASWDSEWTSLTGVFTSDLKPVVAGSDIKVYGRGGDSALWMLNIDTNSGVYDNWASMGGSIVAAGSISSFYRANPEPFADADGIVHTLVIGTDGGLYDNAYNTNTETATWYGLGKPATGSLTSDPSGMHDATNDKILVAARGNGGDLWKYST